MNCKLIKNLLSHQNQDILEEKDYKFNFNYMRFCTFGKHFLQNSELFSIFYIDYAQKPQKLPFGRIFCFLIARFIGYRGNTIDIYKRFCAGIADVMVCLRGNVGNFALSDLVAVIFAN
jgi:hypothetical protein